MIIPFCSRFPFETKGQGRPFTVTTQDISSVIRGITANVLWGNRFFLPLLASRVGLFRKTLLPLIIIDEPVKSITDGQVKIFIYKA